MATDCAHSVQWANNAYKNPCLAQTHNRNNNCSNAVARENIRDLACTLGKPTCCMSCVCRIVMSVDMWIQMCMRMNLWACMYVCIARCMCVHRCIHVYSYVFTRIFN